MMIGMISLLLSSCAAWDVEIQHNLGVDNVFVKRMSLIDVGKDTARMTTTSAMPPSSSSVLVPFTFNAIEKTVFMNLMKHNQLYTVRVVQKSSSFEKVVSVISSLPACLLLQASFQDEFIFHLHSDDRPTIVALDYRVVLAPSVTPPPVSVSLGSSCLQTTVPEVMTGASRARRLLPTPGPEIPLLLPLDPAPLPPGMKKRKDTAQGETASTPLEEQSFFRKYWYIIVAVLVFQLFMAPSEEPATAPAAKAPAVTARK